jgi:hypothetical protein
MSGSPSNGSLFCKRGIDQVELHSTSLNFRNMIRFDARLMYPIDQRVRVVNGQLVRGSVALW